MALSHPARPTVLTDQPHAVPIESVPLWQAINQHSLVSMADLAGRITYVNDNFVRLSGYSREELIGQNHRIVKSTVQDTSFWFGMWKTVSSGQVWRGDVCNRARDGSLYWVNTQISPVFDAHGRTEKYLSIRTDISALKKATVELELTQALQAANEALALSKFYLRAILDLSPDGFVSFDADRRVKYANPAFTRMTHIRLDQIIDRNEQVLEELLASQCSAGCQSLAFEAMRQCSGMPCRHLLELSHGACRNLVLVLQQSDSGPVSQTLYLRDISHETAVDRMKSEFLTTAAHELRTPMASIYGYAELLATEELDPASRTEFTEVLFRHSRGMVAVLDDLLDMARIEARHSLDFVFETTSAHELIKDAAREFRLPPGRLAPMLKLPLEPLHVLADRQKLLQVIQNVLSNAYKYSPQGSSVVIELLPSTSLANTAPKVCIRITDQGIGMTPEQQSRVFERFYRADTSGKMLGTGLGMSIVHEIVTLHGGTVELSCLSGLGTSVTLWLPV